MFEKHSIFIVINYARQLIGYYDKVSTIVSKLKWSNSNRRRRACWCQSAIKCTGIGKGWTY